MLRGLYTAASAMINQRQRMDVLTNNLANLETPGFKKDSVSSRSFNDVLIYSMNNPDSKVRPVGPLTYGSHLDEVTTSFAQGTPEQTGQNTDLALLGDGFFVVETTAGLRYTRAGNFQVSVNGYLCTADGNYVRNTAGGRVYVGTDDFTVAANGTVTSAYGSSRLQIVGFADPKTLQKVGGNLYSSTAAPTASTASVQQGSLEMSNVDMSQEVVNMIEVQRNYEINQRIVNMFNDSLQKTVNEVGKV